MDAGLVGPDGERTRAASWPGSRCRCASTVAGSRARRAAAAPSSSCVTRPGLLVAEEAVETAAARLGRVRRRASTLRLDVPSPPLAVRPLPADVSRSRRRRAVVSSTGARTRCRSSSTPTARSRGLVRLEGTWSRRHERCSPMSYKTCPDWPALMEIAPDLQFKHMTVRTRSCRSRRRQRSRTCRSPSVEICCDSSSTSSTPRTRDPEVAAALAARSGSKCTSGRRPARSGRGPGGADTARRLSSARGDHAHPALRGPRRGARACTPAPSDSTSPAARSRRGTSRSSAVRTG